jgi:hypothetical protein
MELVLYGIGGFLAVVVPAFLYSFFKNAKQMGKDMKENKKKNK